MSAVYFIQSEVSGAVKVGFTKSSPWKRLSEIQVSTPDQLVLLGTKPGDEQVERDLHEQLQRHHIRGEWFEPHEDVLAHIEQPAVKSKKRVASPDDHPLRRWRIENGWTLRRLAAATGGGYAQLSRIEQRHHRPSFLLFVRLEKITGGAVCAQDFLLDGDA